MITNKKILSFVIPALNAGSTIEIVLNAILNQSLDKSLYDVFLVDNGSRDQTLEIAKQIQNKNKKLQILNCPKKGAAATRNYGLLHASTDYIAFIDSDTVIDENWAESMLEEAHILGFAGGQSEIIPVGEENNFLTRYRYWHCQHNTQENFSHLKNSNKSLPIINTAASIFDRKFIQKITGFNEDLRKCEDTDLTLRIFSIGGILMSNENTKACVYCSETNLFTYVGRFYFLGKDYEITMRLNGLPYPITKLKHRFTMFKLYKLSDLPYLLFSHIINIFFILGVISTKIFSRKITNQFTIHPNNFLNEISFEKTSIAPRISRFSRFIFSNGQWVKHFFKVKDGRVDSEVITGEAAKTIIALFK